MRVLLEDTAPGDQDLLVAHGAGRCGWLCLGLQHQCWQLKVSARSTGSPKDSPHSRPALAICGNGFQSKPAPLTWEHICPCNHGLFTKAAHFTLLRLHTSPQATQLFLRQFPVPCKCFQTASSITRGSLQCQTSEQACGLFLSLRGSSFSLWTSLLASESSTMRRGHLDQCCRQWGISA